jgi:hypothetical protein
MGLCQYDYAMECKKQQWKESAAEPNEKDVFLVKVNDLTFCTNHSHILF